VLAGWTSIPKWAAVQPAGKARRWDLPTSALARFLRVYWICAKYSGKHYNLWTAILCSHAGGL